MTRVGIVAAEPSGDQLASHLMAALRQIEPDMQFEGIGGSMMQAQGMDSWFPMEKLSVMGIVEVVRHLPELLGIRKTLVRKWQENPPDLFIGVDAPDCNLGLEKNLRAAGIPTVQYVCPTVWAWRQGRVKTIKQGVDLVLSIYPFEVPLLEKHNVKALYAGHPLAQDLGSIPEQSKVRKQLDLSAEKPVLGLLPGSRISEVSQLTDDFLQAASLLSEKISEITVLLPAATERIRRFVADKLHNYKGLDIRLLDGQSRDVMAAADVVLLASGTAALETMLYKKPMVVAYKVHWMTYFLTVRLGLLKTKYISMPNILAGEQLVPELVTDACPPDNLAREVLEMFSNPQKRQSLESKFQHMRVELAQGNIEQAARGILELKKS